MKVSTTVLTLMVVAVVSADTQFWHYPQQLFNPFAWLRQGKNADTKSTIFTISTPGMSTTLNPPSKAPIPLSYPSSVIPPIPVVPAIPQSSPILPLPSSLAPTTAKLTTLPKEEPKQTTSMAPKVSPKEDLKPKETLESKMGDLDLEPVITVKVTPPPAPTTNAKSPRTTLGTFGSTTKKVYKTKVTASPFYSNSPYVSNSHVTKHTSPVWTTVPITTHGTGGSSHKDKPATDRTQSGHYAYTKPQPQPSHINHLMPNGSSLHGSTVLAHSASTASLSSSMGTTRTPAATVTQAPTTLYVDTTTQGEEEAVGTTEEPRDNHRQHDFYLSKREKPQVKIAANISQNLLPLPAGASAALVKPTKYHYYPHNQHIYLLPECAIQQVCNAVYVRLNWTQPLCACPSRYRDPCSASLNSDDLHTTELQVDRSSKRALTLVKTCEPTSDMRICRSPRDWSLLALQNIRTGKSHYLVICRCPDTSILEGPMSHDQPTYASVPGIRVYGMMCVHPPQAQKATAGGNKRRGRPLRLVRSASESDPPFPWEKAVELAQTADWDD